MEQLNVDTGRGRKTLIRYGFYFNIFLFVVSFFFNSSVKLVIVANAVIFGSQVLMDKFEKRVNDSFMKVPLANKVNKFAGRINGKISR